jgi:hypothetical protein
MTDNDDDGSGGIRSKALSPSLHFSRRSGAKTIADEMEAGGGSGGAWRGRGDRRGPHHERGKRRRGGIAQLQETCGGAVCVCVCVCVCIYIYK